MYVKQKIRKNIFYREQTKNAVIEIFEKPKVIIFKKFYIKTLYFFQ